MTDNKEEKPQYGIPSSEVPSHIREPIEIDGVSVFECNIGTQEEINFINSLYVQISVDGKVWAEGPYMGLMMKNGGVLMKMLDISKRTGKKAMVVITQEKP